MNFYSSEPKVGESIMPTVLEMVGNTPMVRLDKIAKMEGLECELCECVGRAHGTPVTTALVCMDSFHI